MMSRIRSLAGGAFALLLVLGGKFTSPLDWAFIALGEGFSCASPTNSLTKQSDR